MTVVVLAVALCPALLPAQQPDVHYYHQGKMPPGAIGSLQLLQGGPVRGVFQPVEIKAPRGVLVSLAEAGQFTEPQAAPVRAGLLLGRPYRVRVMNVPLYEGLEVFPTIEVVDRLYTPPDQALRFPIEIEMALEDLELALDGKFVTRVIYLEDPQLALPVSREETGRQEWFEAPQGSDPLAVADRLGRPVAILRMGARVPTNSLAPDPQFLYGCPPLVRYAPRAEPPQPAGPTPQPSEPPRPVEAAPPGPAPPRTPSPEYRGP
jgi:hypothetical protein